MTIIGEIQAIQLIGTAQTCKNNSLWVCKLDISSILKEINEKVNLEDDLDNFILESFWTRRSTYLDCFEAFV